MNRQQFEKQVQQLMADHQTLIQWKNEKSPSTNGIFNRYKYPVLSAAHTPVYWSFDLDYDSNPYLMERQGINAVFNSGAIKLNGKYYLIPRIEGNDRKSFFGVAESDNGVDNFKFWDYPITIPETENLDVNVYDMRLTNHEDGWIYGVFCTERKDPSAPEFDTTSASAQAGIVRTKDLKTWQRLPDLKTKSPQQRNVVLHPEFVNGKYAFYTRPQDSFITTGKGGGIGWGLCDDIEYPIVDEEKIIEEKRYHTINEMKNGQGPTPIKTSEGWLHLAHGTRENAAGLRYVLYLLVTDLKDPSRVIYQPGGYLIAPEGDERVGDVSGLVFGNGWIADDDGTVYIYYASCDTILHVATTTIDQLLDYAKSTPPDGLRSAKCVEQRNELIKKNLKILR